MRTAFLISLLCVLICSGASRAANVALSSEGAVAIADSEYSDNYAGVAIDGRWLGPGDPSQSNRWHGALEKQHPHWVWVRFRGPARISKVVIHRADIVDYPVDMSGEYSPDGGLTFRTLFRIVNNTMTPDVWTVERSFAPIVTDNFRLRIDRSSNKQWPNNAQISEIEVLGDMVGDQPKPPVVPAKLSSAPKLKPSDQKGLKITEQGDEIEFRSQWLRMVVSKTRPCITALCWDSLGEGKLDANLLKPGDDGGARLTIPSLFPASTPSDSKISTDGNVVRYDIAFPDGSRARWEIAIEQKSVRMAVTTALVSSEARVAKCPLGLAMAIACDQTPVVPFANPTKSATTPLPSLLHAPDYGSLLIERVDTGGGQIVGEHIRPQARWNASIVAASNARRDGLYVVPEGSSSMELRLSVRSDTTPAPELVGRDPRLHGMSRYWLDGMQYRSDIGILSNNTVSDNCSFCMHQYADIAAFSPDLPGGVQPIQLVRQSLDRYFAGAPGYGVGWEDIMTDTYPSYLIAAWDVIRVTGDMNLLNRWLPHLEKFGAAIERQDHNGNGLPESVKTGVSGEIHCPTGNWWDQINFGHEDAYVSALAYRAFGCLADLERLAKNPSGAKRFQQDAQRIRASYLPTFLNPKTGVIAGWKDTDGNLHDYWFVFVNGIAVAYGLVPDEQANRIVDRIEAKMKEVGFNRFDLGLPGNLVPVPKNDYGIGALGSPQKDDGTDAFGVFENGGASACMAYFYVQALYRLGRRAEGDRILWPMMKTYAAGGFQNGVGHGGEWRHWDGRPSGYEGYLPDAYYSMLALFTGYYGIGLTPDGFRLEPWSPLRGKQTPLGLRYMGRTVREIQ